MKKDLAVIIGLFVLIVVLLVFGRSYSTLNFIGGPNQTSQSGLPKDVVAVDIRNLHVNAKILSKAGERQKGLSGKEQIPFDQGMLFVFENPGKFDFWMKDMKFAIDIIWIDANKRIVDIAVNVPPEPRKKDRELTRYRPRSDAKYVLEVNAGLVQLNGIQIGDSVHFEL